MLASWQGTRLTLVAGALMLIGAAAGFIIVPEHAPQFVGGTSLGNGLTPAASKLDIRKMAYDTLRVTTWALAIVGFRVVALGLIRCWRDRTHDLTGAVVILGVLVRDQVSAFHGGVSDGAPFVFCRVTTSG